MRTKEILERARELLAGPQCWIRRVFHKEGTMEGVMTPVEILRATKAKIADPKHWTKGVFARDAQGSVTSHYDPAAFSFCLMGALLAASIGGKNADSRRDAVQYLHRLVSNEDIYFFNDKHTHEEVINLLDKAICDVEGR